MLFSCTNLSKSYFEKELFAHLSFGMVEGEKVGIIGRNGAGKSSLLRIIAGIDTADGGDIAKRRDLHVEYLDQDPQFADGITAVHAVAFEGYHSELSTQSTWDRETQARIILGKLGLNNPELYVQQMSGGQRKRVALARALLSDADLLILDEPTNHLDADTTQWLQDELVNSSKGLLLVTHDRYFLDAVCTRIVELDQLRLISYEGGYAKYLERKEAMLAVQDATAAHERNKLRRELAWLARGAKAQRKQQKSRIDWIKRMEPEVKQTQFRDIEIELGHRFLGGRIIDAENVGVKGLFHSFSWRAQPGERIGIIGANGAGKTTLLRILAGESQADSGWVNRGDTVTLGFFRQEIRDLHENESVLANVRSIAEYIDVGVGRDRYISARELCDRFGFGPKQQNAYVHTLSGGELRRLGLLRVLMANPNVLFMDEPTNDFDIVTLNALEEYLQYFKGVLLIVSHDRAFLDKVATTIWSFQSDGVIKEWPGNYSAYLEAIEAHQRISTRSGDVDPEPKNTPTKQETIATATAPLRKKKSPWDEKHLKELENQLMVLEAEKSLTEMQLGDAGTPYSQIAELTKKLGELQERIEQTMEQWLEISERE